MVDCIDAAKVLITKKIISNPTFKNTIEYISKEIQKIDAFNTWSKDEVSRRAFLEEALEIAYETTLLDLPRTDLQKVRVLNKYSKVDDLAKKKALFDIVDNIKYGTLDLPEGEMDKILAKFDVDPKEFEIFVDNLSIANNKKIVTEFVRNKNFNIKKVFDRLADKQTKEQLALNEEVYENIYKQFEKALESVIKKDMSKVQIRKVFKDFSENQFKKIKRDKDVFKKIMDIYDEVVDEYIEMVSKLAVETDALIRKDYREQIKNIKLKFRSITQSEFSIYKEDESTFDKILSSYEWGVDEFFTITDNEFKSTLLPEEWLVWDELDSTKKLNERIIKQRDESLRNYVLSKAVLDEAVSIDEYTMFLNMVNWAPTWDVNVATINSLTEIDDLRNLLMLNLKEFKDKDLLAAFKARMDELSYWKDTKLVQLLKSLENLTDKPVSLIEEIANAVPKKTKVKKPTRVKVDNDSYPSALLSFLSKKPVSGEVYFYNNKIEGLSEETEAYWKAFWQATKKHAIKIWPAKVISKEDIKEGMNVVVENLNWAKELLGDTRLKTFIDPIQPNLLSEWQTYNFFVEDWQLYIGAKTESDFDTMKEILDTANIEFAWADLSEGIDWYMNAIEVRYGKDKALAVREAIERFTWYGNIPEQEAFLQDLMSVNPYFIPQPLNKKELIEQFPDWIEDPQWARDFYYREAQKLAARFWVTIQEKEVLPIKELRQLYWDIVFVEPNQVEQWSDKVQEFLDVFGAAWWAIEDSNATSIYMKSLKILSEDGFYMPAWQPKTTFDKIRRWERVDNEHFMTIFVSKNRSKLAELPWFTEFDKAVTYLRNTLNKAKEATWQTFNVSDTPWGFGVYFIRTENQYMDALSDMSDAVYKWTSDTIAEDFWRLFEVIDDYVADTEAMIKRWASELEHYQNNRQVRSAIAEYEENFLLPRYEGLLRQKDILTKRYDIFKVTKAEELDILKERVQSMKDSFQPILTPDVNITTSKQSLQIDWVAYATASDGRKTSVTIDNLIDMELRKSKWPISNLKNVNLTWYTNREKYKILQNLRAARIAESLGNTASRIYEKLFPSLKGFFSDYELINIEQGRMLPKLLARTNATANIPNLQQLDMLTDRNIKYSILEDISPLVREGKLNKDTLRNIVEAKLKIADIPKELQTSDYIDSYLKVFRPYELLVKIPDGALNDFAEKVRVDMWNIDQDLLDDVPVMVDWKETTLRDMLKEPETTFPRVILEKQTFAKPEIWAVWENFIKQTEDNMRLLKDDIDFAQNGLDDIQKNVFNETQLIMNKSPRLKRLKEIIFTTADSAQAAWNFISKIKSKEQLVWIQGFVERYMTMTDEQFFAVKESMWEPYTAEAWVISDYFRRLNRLLPQVPDDAWVKGIFWETQRKFLNQKFNRWQLVWFGISVKRSQLFSFVPYKKLEISQEWGLLWLFNRVNDPVELDEFNRIFWSNLTMDEFQRMLVWLADWELLGYFQRMVYYYGKFMRSPLLWGRIARALTSRPYAATILHQQVFGYKSMEYGLNNIIWDIDYKPVWELRRRLGILSWEIPELSSVWVSISNKLADTFWTKWAKTVWEMINELKNEDLWFLIDSVKDNANNMVDVVYSGAIKNRVFMDAVLTNNVKSFFNFKEFENWITTAPVAEREFVLEAIQRQSVEQFENLMGFNNIAILEWTGVWVRASLWKLFEITTGFRSGWWLNVAKRAFKKFSKWGEVAMYLYKNWLSNESIENAVQYFARDRDMQIFMNQIMFDIYYAYKLKRFIDTRSWDDTEDENFFEFIWNEFLDYKWWAEAFWTISQSYQGLYSAWPLRPFLFAVEAAVWERDGSIASAFIEWIRGAAFRQFKLLNNLAVTWMKVAGEIQLDWVSWDEAIQLLSDFAYETSAGTLRYVMSDKDYQKSLFYAKDEHNPMEVILGINTNPYIEAEARMQRIAAEQTLETDLPRAMRDLLYWTYVGKFYNTVKWGLKYWLDAYNLRDKTDIKQVIESNPVYLDYISEWKLNLQAIPEEFRWTVYENIKKKFTNSGYMPWSYKQIDGMEERLKNSSNEEWLEEKTKYGWAQAAAINIYNFIWKDDVQQLVNLVKSDKTKKNADDVKEDLVYNFIKDKIAKVPTEKKPYGYYYMDLAYFLTRDMSTKWKSKLELELEDQGRVNRVLNVFMNRDAFELEQDIYKDARDEMLLEALYYSDKEAFEPYFSVTPWSNDREYVRFDSQYKWFIDWMNQVLMSAKKDNLDAYEVAFSSLVKTYKDKPEAAVAVYNELNRFLTNNTDIENKEEMLDWFLIKNSELLEDPELLKTQIWEEQYNELLFNIKRREEEIKEKVLAYKDPLWWSWGKLKKTEGKFKALPAIKKIAWDFKSYSPKWNWWPVSYANPKWKLGWAGQSSGRSSASFGKYNAQSVDLYGNKKETKDIKRSIKAIKRKLLTWKQLWL